MLRKAYMGRETTGWIDYWKTETLFDDFQFQKNMDIFVRGSEPIMEYGAGDVVLDIGCGPGFLEAALRDRVKEIHGLDVSERYLDRCRERFQGQPNVCFYKLDEQRYTDLSFLPAGTFSKIVCLSVIQYYKSIGEVEELISGVRRVALPGARFLIADIIVDNSWWRDTWGVLKAAWEDQFLFRTLLFLLRARLSGYYRVRASRGLLQLTVEQLRDLIKRLGLNAEVLSARLTTNGNRRHLLIQF